MPQNRVSKDASGAKPTTHPTGSTRSKVVSGRRRLNQRSTPPLSSSGNSEPPPASEAKATIQLKDDLTATPTSESEPTSGISASSPAQESEAKPTIRSKDDLTTTPPGNSEPISGISASSPTQESEVESTTQPKDVTATPPSESEPTSGISASSPAQESEAEATTQPKEDLTATPHGNSEPISGISAASPTQGSEAEATTPPKDDLTATPHGNSEPISGISAASPTQGSEAEATTPPKDDLTATPPGNSEPISGISAASPTQGSEAEATTPPKDDSTSPRIDESCSEDSASSQLPVYEAEITNQSTALPSGHPEFISRASTEFVKQACEEEVTTQHTGDSLPSGHPESISATAAEHATQACEEEVTTQHTDDSLPSGHPESISVTAAEHATQACEEEVTTQYTGDSLPSGHPESISATAAEHATQACEEEVTTQHTDDSLPSGHPESISATAAEHATQACEEEITTQHTALPSGHPKSISVTNAEHATQASEEEVTPQHTSDSSPSGNLQSTSDASAPSLVPAFEGEAVNQPTGECKLVTVNNCFDYDGKEEPVEALVVENTQTIDTNELFQHIYQEVKRNSKDNLIEKINRKICFMGQMIQQQAENLRRLENKIVANEEATKIIDVTISQTMSPTSTVESNYNATASSLKTVPETGATIEPTADLSPSSTAESNSNTTASSLNTVTETGATIEPTADLSPTSTVESNYNATASSLKTVPETGPTIEPTADLSPSSTAESNSNDTASSLKTVSETGATIEPTADCQKDEDVESREESVVRNIQSIDSKLVQHISREVMTTINGKLRNMESWLEFLRDQIIYGNHWTNQQVNSIKGPEITKGQDIEYKDTNLAKEEAHENSSVREPQIVLPSSTAEAKPNASSSSLNTVSETVVTIEPTADSTVLSPGNADSNSGATASSMNTVPETGANIEPTADSSSICTHNSSPRLTFHRSRGTGIRVSNDGYTVMKLDGSENEFVYSDRPIEIGEKVYLRFLEVRNFDPWFTVGLTSREPMSSVTPISLEFVENMSNRVYWTKNLERNLYEKGTLISYYVNPAGEIHFDINNEYKGILTDGVDINVPLWVCLIIATYGTTLQFVDPQSLAQTETVDSLLGELMSEMNILTFNNLPTYFDSEIKNVSYVFTEKPLQTKHMLFIKILKVEKARSGSLAIGVTACDPATLYASDLPDDVEMLHHRPEYWSVSSDVVNGLEQDDELEVTMTVNKEIQVSRNGAPAFTVMHIYNLELLWAFVYTYGATQKTRILTRRQISSSYKTSKISKQEKNNITHEKCSSSMTPVFGQKASFQSPFGRLFNFGTSPTSTFSASSTNHVPTNTPNPSFKSAINDSSELLRFQSAPGEVIRVSEDGSTVSKLHSASMGLVCSARPVNIGEKVCLRLLEVRDFDSWFAVGFTSRKPMSQVTGSTPQCVENMSNHLSWMKDFKRDLYTKGTILCYFVNLVGEVHFEIDGEYKGILIEGVDTSVPLWVCLIIAKYGTTLELVDPRSLPKTETLDSVLNGLLSRMDFNFPIPFDSETNNVSYVFTEKPLEISQIISIEILKAEKTHLGYLSIGVTSCDPTTLLPSDLPDDVEMLNDRPEYWEVSSGVVNRLEEGDEIKVILTVNGEIQVSRNGGPAFTVLDINNELEPLWAFVYTYGATQKTRILTSSQTNLYYNKLKTPLLSSAKSVIGPNDSCKVTVSGARGTITQRKSDRLFNSNTSKAILRAPKLTFTGSTSSKAPKPGASSNSVQSAAGGSFNPVTSNSLISGGSKLACGSSTSTTIPVFGASGTSTQPTAGGSFNFAISNPSTSAGSKTDYRPSAFSTMQVPGAGGTQPTPDSDVVSPNQSNASGTLHVRPNKRIIRKNPSKGNNKQSRCKKEEK